MCGFSRLHTRAIGDSPARRGGCYDIDGETTEDSRVTFDQYIKRAVGTERHDMNRFVSTTYADCSIEQIWQVWLGRR